MDTFTATTATAAPSRPRRRALLGFALAASILLLGAGAQSARADFAITEFDGTVLDSSGEPFTQAGGHPDSATTTFSFSTTTNPGGQLIPDGQFKDVEVDLPPGLVGNASAFPQCTEAELRESGTGAFPGNCPANSAVGEVTLFLTSGFPIATVPIFNMIPPPGVPAQFAFNGIVLAHLNASVRTGDDYGLTVSSRDVTQPEFAPINGFTVTFWGVPADHNSGNAPRKPFLTLPTACLGPQTTTIRADSWQDPGNFITASFLSHDNEDPPNPIGADGCENVPFDPEVSLQPTSSKADSPTGLDVELTMPQNQNPDGISQAHLKRTEVTLPEGMAINPSAADGLGACSPDEIGLDNDQPANCPSSSKIGTVSIDTPLLEETLEGSVHQAEQGNNPFDSDFAIYLTAENEERGVLIKLPGEVSPDPETGRLTTTFDDNPQLPFSSFRLRFKGGPRAPLVNPPTCGAYDINSELSPWSAADPDNPTPDELVTQTSSFAIDKGPNGGACLAGNPSQPGDPGDLDDRPFNLGFTAGVQNPQAASRSPFTVNVTRPDGHQEIERLDAELPQGVAASLRGVPLCEESDAANANCGPESQIGTVQAAAGAGSNPFWVTDGKVFLTGPYKGAKLGLSIVVPAVAGPFDLGEVALRAALFVDRADAHITVNSDPIPQILEGVPLRTREMRIRIDRPEFTLAGTSCTESQVSAEANGVNGASTQLAERFQLSGCRGLGFDPKFRFKAIGKKSTPRLAHPRLRATVRPRPRQGANANISRARVTLPRGIELDQANVARPCTRAQFADDACPSRTQMGRAIARSPLLDDPVQGPVYLVTSDNELPDLLADLNGIVDVDLRGRIDTTRRTQRIRNTFALVPDVPVGFFRLNLRGGDRGLLVNSTDRCENRRQNRIKVGTKGHNGSRADQRPLMRTRCSKRG